MIINKSAIVSSFFVKWLINVMLTVKTTPFLTMVTVNVQLVAVDRG